MEKNLSNGRVEEGRMKCDLCTQLFSVRCIITFRALFLLNCQFLHEKAKIYPLTRRRKSRTRRLISLSIAHPKKLAHDPNWRGIASFAALLLISTLTSKLWVLFKILISSFDCPFNTTPCREMVNHTYQSVHITVSTATAGHRSPFTTNGGRRCDSQVLVLLYLTKTKSQVQALRDGRASVNWVQRGRRRLSTLLRW